MESLRGYLGLSFTFNSEYLCGVVAPWSKAKGSVVKPPVSKNVDVEIVVIDDEE